MVSIDSSKWWCWEIIVGQIGAKKFQGCGCVGCLGAMVL